MPSSWPPQTYEDLLAAVREARNGSRLTQTQLGAKFGLDQGQISAIETQGIWPQSGKWRELYDFVAEYHTRRSEAALSAPKNVICPACDNPTVFGGENRQIFCGYCGARIGWRCVQCKASNVNSAQFCGECGAHAPKGEK